MTDIGRGDAAGEAVDRPGMSALPMSNFRRLRAVVGGSAGNLVEWYDWYIFPLTTAYVAPAFFPDGDETAQLLKNAAVFAAGFFVRPLGAWAFGRLADRAGRRAAMTLSVALMCLGALIMAAAPGYAVIGPFAPVLLLGARLLQGFSVGGEYGASATYLSEVAGRARRGLWSSFHYVTLIAGQLIASAVVLALRQTLGEEALQNGAWRIAFLIGAGLAVVVFWMRRGLDETPSFLAAAREATGAPAAQTAFRAYPVESAMIFVLTAAGSLNFYAYTANMPLFLTRTAGLPQAEAGLIMTAALLFFALIQPVMGALSDRFGRRRMLAAAFGLSAVTAVPVFSALAAAPSALGAFAIIAGAMVIQAAYTSISAVIKAELFPASVRALGVSLPYALGNALCGGTAQYVSLAFKKAGLQSGFYWYVAALSLLGFFVALRMRDTQHASRILED